jgi:hypothetical protein
MPKGLRQYFPDIVRGVDDLKSVAQRLPGNIVELPFGITGLR